jgi:thiamine biosynthesis protein ThiS
MSDKATLEVNGRIIEYDKEALPATVLELIDSLGLDATMVVAEINAEIVKRCDLAERGLSDGDKVELVRFVGGG